MSALPRIAPGELALVLLGVGGVGRALLAQLAGPAARGLHLVGVADSVRQVAQPRGLVPARAADLLRASACARDDAALLAALDASGAARRVVIDATAADATAARHADWLARGCDVVSANKAAAGGPLARWRSVRRGAVCGDVRYGDAATVGAGLPVLSTLRRLRVCGDRLLAIEGVFSGSLSWLFNRFDGGAPFSTLLREACAAGYTEPDPRLDLDGSDAARKLLILARTGGHALEEDAIEVESLVPPSLREVDRQTFLQRAHELDPLLEARRRRAAAGGRVLRFLARCEADGMATAGLREVAPTHPAARLTGTDNLYVLTTSRYREQPLVIQGPGAGTGVTAQALLGDILALRG